jgi:hypothetical protein
MTHTKQQVEVKIVFFPRLIDRWRETERPRPISQWTLRGELGSITIEMCCDAFRLLVQADGLLLFS